MRHMWSWTLTIALYVLGMALFNLLGGLGAASRAFQRWGETSARRRGPALLRGFRERS
jgi:hypothetical protein